MAEIAGTEGQDVLTGTAGADVINGFGGYDQIDGKAGDDVINGGADYDSIQGGLGNDIVDGGDGGDYLSDDGGSDTLRGGAGDDTISLFRASGGAAETVVIDGGIGNDSVSFVTYRQGSTTIDLGEGADWLDLSSVQNNVVRATLGTGRDQVMLSSFTNLTGSNVAITDFALGDAGDTLIFDQYLNNQLVGWDPSTNPFGASGFIRLVQVGADTVLQIDRDGASGANGNTFQTLLTFQNTNATLFTAGNFGGFAPDGSPITGRTITGTEGNDILTGTAGADIINGFGAHDEIDGKAGDDVINGGASSDQIQGGLGNDVIDGGDDGDFLSDEGGSDTLRGGAGDDNISIFRSTGGAAETIVIEGGTGNDRVNFSSSNHGSTSIDLGEGADRLDLSSVRNNVLRATLGTGRDQVTLSRFDDLTGSNVAFTDFALGESGDTLIFDQYLNTQLVGWDPSTNPFGASSFVRLVQVGADTVLQIDRDGASSANGNTFQTLLTFQNANATLFTASNFAGFAPDGSPIMGQTIAGTEGQDILTGTAGADVINGFGGYDQIDGKAGDDVINGGADDDSIQGGLGNDVVDGGDGGDYLSDEGGSDILRGGAGDDSISLFRGGGGTAETIVIEGGTGNDRVNFSSSYHGSTSIDLGEGADQLDLSSVRNNVLRATLGIGRDQVTLSRFGELTGSSVAFTDFALGESGDTLIFDQYLNTQLVGWDPTTNPFGASGYVRLVQIDTDTVLQIDRDGVNGRNGNIFESLLTFQNTNATLFTAANFAGFAPRAITAAEAATAFVTAAVSATEGSTAPIMLSLTLKDVGRSTVSTSVTVSFAADRSTATNGVDASVSSFSGNYSIAQSPTGNYVITLPSAAILDDFLIEGTETLSVRVTASGRVFDTGTDSTVATIALLDNDFNGTTAADTLTGDGGRNYLAGLGGNDILIGFDGDDLLLGGVGNDRLDGGTGNDVLATGGGNDIVDGGVGFDTLVLDYGVAAYGLLQDEGRTFLTGPDGATLVSNVEQFQFRDRALGSADAIAALAPFDALRYIASHTDLALAFGTNTAAATSHFANAGFFEGRSTAAFSGLNYIASHADLGAAFGTNILAATSHYVTTGVHEGRGIGFDPYLYVASYSDLIVAFGIDGDRAASHYIGTGRAEGRQIDFDVNGYLASNPFLIAATGVDPHAVASQYIQSGFFSGLRTDGFNALRYTASHGDLIGAFGFDTAAATRHFVTYGFDEGRSPTSFSPLEYSAANVDLARAFGVDGGEATRHYVATGFLERRETSGFDAQAYLLDNDDLLSVGYDEASALFHWVAYGAREGRIGDAGFGREQASHAIVSGVGATAAIECAADQDWFTADVIAGQRVHVDLASAFAGEIEVHDSTGRLIASGMGQGRTVLDFDAIETGAIFFTVAGAGDLDIGTYALTIGAFG